MPSQTLPWVTIRLLTIMRDKLLPGLPLCLSYYGLRLALDREKPRAGE